MPDKLQIQIPEGYEIDTFDLKTGLVTFKKKFERWRDNPKNIVEGYYISSKSNIQFSCGGKTEEYNNIFASKAQAKSALAMAQLSQIIANDSRFGGPVTDEEWNSSITKYYLYRYGNRIGASLTTNTTNSPWEFLAFHTPEQRNLFLQENMDLIKQYFML